jgi:hypothetical protein
VLTLRLSALIDNHRVLPIFEKLIQENNLAGDAAFIKQVSY